MRQSLWKVIGVGSLLAVLAVPEVPAQSVQPRLITRADYVEAYQARRDSLLRFYAYRYEAVDLIGAGDQTRLYRLRRHLGYQHLTRPKSYHFRIVTG